MELIIRELRKDEVIDGLEFVGRVFDEFDAPDYSEEGIAAFHRTLKDKKYASKIKMYGAFDGEKLIGVIATREKGTHIAMFFVDGKYHRRGIGRKLLYTAMRDCNFDTMTVGASPYAVNIYRHLGFRETAKEQCEQGFRFTPMSIRIN